MIGERAERLGTQGDLRIELEGGVEGDRHASVDAAHAVDGDLLDQQLFLDELVLLGLVDNGGGVLHTRGG